MNAASSEPMIDVSALMKAVGVGIGLFLLLICLGVIVGLVGGGAMIAAIANPGQLSSEAAAGALGGIILFVCLAFCLEVVFLALTGASYGFFVKRSKGSVSIEKGALGGLLATDILYVIGWGLGLCASIALVATNSSLGSQYGLGNTVGGIGSVLLQAVVRLVVGLIIVSLIGGLSGLLYAAIGGKPATAAPPSPM